MLHNQVGNARLQSNTFKILLKCFQYAGRCTYSCHIKVRNVRLLNHRLVCHDTRFISRVRSVIRCTSASNSLAEFFMLSKIKVSL